MTGPREGARGPRSLRWRVVVVAVAVVAVAFVVVGLAVEVVLDGQLQRDARGRLDDRVVRAEALVAQGTSENDLPSLLDGQGIRAGVRDAAGRRVAGVLPRLRPAAGTAARAATQAVVALPDGDRLVLAADPDETDVLLSRLRGVLVAVGAGGLVVTAGALLLGVRGALRPLDAMTRLAREIAAGGRGGRLRLGAADTELGRTAAAFDAMLDALESAQARAEEAAGEARRSEATTRRFLSDAAHELRTPLAGVQALAESLVRRPDADLAHRERVATTLVRETRRAGALVADLLELARIEGGPALALRTVDLAALAAAEAERSALLDPALPVLTRGGPVLVEADPERVAQILVNLVDNARRHSPPGGTVVLDVGRAGGVARIDVVDEGGGVPAAERERVFDRLVRLDEARRREAESPTAGTGAGLGLAIARGLARAHGGDLGIVDDGVGPRFRLTLPALGPEGPAPDGPGGPGELKPS